jgi:hypothetical protein
MGVIPPLLTIYPFASRVARKDAARPWSSSLAPGESGTLVFTGWAETDGEMMVDSARADTAVIESAPTRHSIRTNTNFLFIVHQIFSRSLNSPSFSWGNGIPDNTGVLDVNMQIF